MKKIIFYSLALCLCVWGALEEYDWTDLVS